MYLPIYLLCKFHQLFTSSCSNDPLPPVSLHTQIIYDVNITVRNSAMYSILLTIFVGIMMVGGAIVFAADAQRLVIAPIERMVNLVEAVARNPLAVFSSSQSNNNAEGGAREKESGDYETKLLETTIEKITSLLRVGFGEAGAGIISANLSTEKGASATINPLLPGQRIYAMFGFCDIHQFEDINQKLANDVLTFVNTIADVVHNSVHTWSGQCNKNLGNAFVIVWRIGDEETLLLATGGGVATNKRRSNSADYYSPMRGSTKSVMSTDDNGNDDNQSSLTRKNRVVDLRRVPGVDVLADHALIGYLKIIAEINRNRNILKYRQEPRLTDNGHHEFKVRMGFGLHAGWAIEGAVGSIQKVDATYLSPHVNMAARLETSSRQYGVPLLASQDFYDLLSSEAQNRCRRLDVVTVKGSEVPIGIYTYDALQEQEFRDNKKTKRSSLGQSKKADTAVALAGQQVAAEILDKNNGPGGASTGGGRGSNSPSPHASGTSSPARRPSLTLAPGTANAAQVLFLTPEDETGDIFERDYDMLKLRQHVTSDFLDCFKEGIGLYLGGDWPQAKVLLERADSMMLELAPALGGDGPSKTLLRYMAAEGFKAPPSWKGFRPLTAK